MNNFEDIYNKAVQMLKAGHSEEEVLLEFAEYKNELTPLLKLSAALMAMPKNIVPTPLMKRKYALAPVKSLWLTWLHLSKFAAVSVSVMLLVSTVTVVGYQASKSSPGQTLFSVKKSTEKLQLILAQDQKAKANLQIKFAEKRLNEAEAVLKDPDSDQEEKTAVLEELADQTSSAVAEVDTATQTNPEPENTQPLLASLDGIADKQQSLLEEIEEDSQIKPAAETALQTLNENTEKISAIKLVVAAADNEKALAILKADENSVAILGNVTKISKDKITVEKTDFLINEDTLIKDTNGAVLNLKDLALQTKVNIVGQKNETTLLAKQIVAIKPKDLDADSKQASTTTSSITSVTSTPVSLKKLTESPSTTPAVQINPNAAIGSFILEDPAPQFVK